MDLRPVREYIAKYYILMRGLVCPSLIGSNQRYPGQSFNAYVEAVDRARQSGVHWTAAGIFEFTEELAEEFTHPVLDAVAKLKLSPV